MCKKHEEEIWPRYIKQNMDVGCPKCVKEWGREKRTEEFDNNFIACINSGKKHPKRQCARALYIKSGGRQCNWCKRHKADGSRTPTSIRQSRRRHIKRTKKLNELRAKEQMQHNTIPNDWSVEYYG